MVPISLERWVLTPSVATCYGCRYLAGVGPFRAGVGPRPPLHEHCRCRRLVYATAGMSVSAFNALVAEADRNGARAAAIERRALNLRDRG